MRHHSCARAWPCMHVSGDQCGPLCSLIRSCDNKLWRQSPDCHRSVKVTADVQAFRIGWRRVCARVHGSVCFSSAGLRLPPICAPCGGWSRAPDEVRHCLWPDSYQQPHAHTINLKKPLCFRLFVDVLRLSVCQQVEMLHFPPNIYKIKSMWVHTYSLRMDTFIKLQPLHSLRCVFIPEHACRWLLITRGVDTQGSKMMSRELQAFKGDPSQAALVYINKSCVRCVAPTVSQVWLSLTHHPLCFLTLFMTLSLLIIW